MQVFSSAVNHRNLIAIHLRTLYFTLYIIISNRSVTVLGRWVLHVLRNNSIGGLHHTGCILEMVPVADPEGGGGLGGLTPPPPPSEVVFVLFACQYMRIPTDLDPKPRLRRILAQNPPPPLKNS